MTYNQKSIYILIVIIITQLITISFTTTNTTTNTTVTTTSSTTPQLQNWVNEWSWPKTCLTGLKQSPIDIPESKYYAYNLAPIIRILSSSYTKQSFQLSIKDNTLDNFLFQVEILGNGYITIVKNLIRYKYNGIGFYFHYDSEHTFAGERGDIELHIVHQKDNDDLKRRGILIDPDRAYSKLIIAIRFNISQDGKSNSEIEKLNLASLGPTSADFDINSFIPVGKPVFHYGGSTTHPGCTEDANWLIQEEIQTLSQNQYNLLKAWIYGKTRQKNIRLTKPLNGRIIYYLTNNDQLNENQPNYTPVPIASRIQFNWENESEWADTCHNGQRQSPIDIPSYRDFIFELDPFIKILSTNYEMGKLKLSVKDESFFQLEIQGKGYIIVEKNNIKYKYDGIGFYFHYDSSHTIGGSKSDIEIHIVHQKNQDFLTSQSIFHDPDQANQKLVVAIRLNAGGTDNKMFEKLNLKTIGDTEADFDINYFIPFGKPIFHYLGSITNPTCDENVNWIIQHEILIISTPQYEVLKAWIYMFTRQKNTRPTKPLNNRKIYYQTNSLTVPQTKEQPKTHPIISAYLRPEFQEFSPLMQLDPITSRFATPLYTQEELDKSFVDYTTSVPKTYTTIDEFNKACSSLSIAINEKQCIDIKLPGFFCCQVNYKERNLKSYCAPFTAEYTQKLLEINDLTYHYVCSIRNLETFLISLYIILIIFIF